MGDSLDATNSVTVMSLHKEGLDNDKLSGTISLNSALAMNQCAYEINTENNEGTDLPWWFPRIHGKPVFYGNKEAFGWCLEATARYVAVTASGAFVTTTWLNIVKEAAGCEMTASGGNEEVAQCNETIYGIKPSSALSMYGVIIGIFSSISLPIVGAFVDYTCHRRLIGRWCSSLLCILLIPTFFISDQTWELIAVCTLFAAVVSWGETAVSDAYLPELTDDEDKLNYFMKMFSVIPCLSVVIFISGVLGVAYLLGFQNDDIKVARFAQVVAFLVSSVLLALAWGFLLQRRPQSNHLDEGKSIWTEGFIQVYRTMKKIRGRYNALKWFYIATVFSEAGSVGFFPLAVTYQTDVLMLSSTENGMMLLAGLIGTVPGAFIGSWVNKRLDPIWSSIFGTSFIIAVIAIYTCVLTGPGQQVESVGVGLILGIGTGWKWTVDRFLASIIIPEGQDAELMGFYNCASNILAWIPPVIFTILNEVHISQRIGAASPIIFLLIGAISYFGMGDYREALIVANRIVPSDEISSTNVKDASITKSSKLEGVKGVETSMKKIEVEVAGDTDNITQSPEKKSDLEVSNTMDVSI